MVHCAGHMPSRTVAVPPGFRLQDKGLGRCATVQVLPLVLAHSPPPKDAGNGRRDSGGTTAHPRRCDGGTSPPSHHHMSHLIHIYTDRVVVYKSHPVTCDARQKRCLR